MFHLFHLLAERVKALFLTHVALDFEAEFVARDAERKAELLRQAERYEQEGLHGIAQHIRQQADHLNTQRPLGSVLPAISHLQGDLPRSAKMLALPDRRSSSGGSKDASSRSSFPKRKRKGGKS